jgi:hypothetical protein
MSNNHQQKYKTSSMKLKNVVAEIDGKNIIISKKGTRITESINLLNAFINEEKLMPDILISNNVVTTTSSPLNTILLNLLGEVNNIFFDIDKKEFKTIKIKEEFPKMTISLKKSFDSRHWIKIKQEMLISLNNEDLVNEMIDNAADIIEKLLNSDFVIRTNLTMLEEKFFKLSV